MSPKATPQTSVTSPTTAVSQRRCPNRHDDGEPVTRAWAQCSLLSGVLDLKSDPRRIHVTFTRAVIYETRVPFSVCSVCLGIAFGSGMRVSTAHPVPVIRLRNPFQVSAIFRYTLSNGGRWSAPTWRRQLNTRISRRGVWRVLDATIVKPRS